MGLAQCLAAAFLFLLYLGECPAQWPELSWKCSGESRAWGAQPALLWFSCHGKRCISMCSFCTVFSLLNESPKTLRGFQ